MSHLCRAGLLCVVSGLCLFGLGCVAKYQQGVEIPLSPEHRNKIDRIGILITDSAFQVKYVSNRDMTGTSTMGGLLGALLQAGESGACKNEDEKLARQMFASISPEYDFKDRLARQIQSELKLCGYQKTVIVSSREQAKEQNLNSLLVCEVTGWGVCLYPKVKMDDTLSTFIDLKASLSLLPEDAAIWKFANLYLLHNPRPIKDFQDKTNLMQDLDQASASLARKLLNRLMNS